MNLRGETLYVENAYSINLEGKAHQTIGRTQYEYDYGNVINVKVRAGARLGNFDLGGFGEIHLADHLRVRGGAFWDDTGRCRLVSVGPELTWSNENYAISVLGRLLIDSTKDASFDTLGNLMGFGVSEGSIGTSIRMFF